MVTERARDPPIEEVFPPELFPKWLPFPAEAYNSSCDSCPKPGWENIPQRAFLRASVLLYGKRDRRGEQLIRRIGWWRSAYFAAFALEIAFFAWERALGAFMRLFLWLLLFAVLIGPAYYVLFSTNAQIPPLAQVLLDILLLIVSWILSREVSIISAKQQANAKWIPQSRQACRGLLTVWAELQAFRQELAQMCGTLTKELPEMQEDKMRGARTVLSSQCKNGASRIDAISNHLTDSVAAWETFIKANCEGMECAAIQQELNEHRIRLATQIASLQQSGHCPIDNSNPARAMDGEKAMSSREGPDEIFAHVADSPTDEGFTQVLTRQDGAWNGGNISVRADKVIIDGAHYPLISQNPIHAKFQHQGRTVEITE